MRAVLLIAFLWAGLSVGAHADTLRLPAEAPTYMHWGAAALLWLHILGGAIGLLTGAAALAMRKGSKPHRFLGRIFFVAMFVTYAIGAGVAPFLETGQRPNFIAGLMALYLLISGVLAARTPKLTAGWAQGVGLVVAGAMVIAGVLFMQIGARDPSGTVDGSPPQAFVLFIVVGVIAGGGEVNLLIRKSLMGPPRIVRHLWRMCMSLFIASASFFLGQQQVLPDWMRGSPLQFGLALAPLGALVVWGLIVRWPRRRPAAA